MNIFFMNSRNCYRPNDYESTLNELLSIGINTVFIVTFHYAENEASDSLFMTKESIPESTVCRIIDQTRSKGIEPVLKPHIDLTNDMPRYKIKPGDIQKWVDSYSKIAVQYAKISDSCGLNRFVVGTELDNIADSKAFSAMIRRDVRQAFKGELIYAASFDHFITTGVLEDFDAIGVNSYFNLCQRQNCSEAELTESWNYWLNVIDRVSILKRKPVYITEVGFYSRFGCTIDPGDWSRPGGVSYEEQAQAYEALLCQAYQFDNVKGIFWWNWELNNAWGNDSADFTPRNKLSVDIVRKYWN